MPSGVTMTCSLHRKIAPVQNPSAQRCLQESLCSFSGLVCKGLNHTSPLRQLKAGIFSVPYLTACQHSSTMLDEPRDNRVIQGVDCFFLSSSTIVSVRTWPPSSCMHHTTQPLDDESPTRGFSSVVPTACNSRQRRLSSFWICISLWPEGV